MYIQTYISTNTTYYNNHTVIPCGNMAAFPTNPLFDLGDLLPGDILVVVAPKDETDEYWFNIPGSEEVVWLVSIKEIRNEPDGNNRRWFLTGYFYKNATRNLLDTLVKDDHTYPVDFLEGAVIEVYGEDDDLKITNKDVKKIKSNLKKVIKWEKTLEDE